jgi:DNA-binding transcriptional LysR family regulator
MIENFRGLAIFVAVADAGSFSNAGRRLKLSTSVVSHHLSKLESKLGVSLFFRSTRSLSLTPEGQSILPAARRMVDAGVEALDELAETSDQPVGALRLTMPAHGDQSHVHQAVWEFARTYPLVTISLSNSNKAADLVKEGFDLAIRLGRLADSTLKNRKIGQFGRVVVASPAYLATRPPVETLEDLNACEFIAISIIPNAMTLMRNGEQILFEPEKIRLEVDSISTAKTAILAGLGVQHLPTSEAEQELKDGRLVRVLPEWSLPEMGVYAVWPDVGPQKKLTRRLIDFLVDYTPAQDT